MKKNGCQVFISAHTIKLAKTGGGDKQHKIQSQQEPKHLKTSTTSW
jgi:hypothetical protein